MFWSADVLGEPSGVYIRASEAIIVLVIEECVQKLCNSTATIVFVKDVIAISRKTLAGS